MYGINIIMITIDPPSPISQVTLNVSMPAVAWRRWSAELLKLGASHGAEALLEGKRWRRAGETLEKR